MNLAVIDKSRTLIGRFLCARDAYPGRVALEIADFQLTYEQLWNRAALIGSTLQQVLDPSEPVAALLAYRSPTAYAGVLGILASGRGYVPLNPKFPVDRTLRMVVASGVKALVVGEECATALQALLPQLPHALTFLVDGGLAVDWSKFPQHRVIDLRELKPAGDGPVPAVHGDSTAYLLFTSGSTGVPKGVAVSQSNAAAYFDFTSERYALTPEDRCSQNFDLTFDLSVHDLFLCWGAGATLCPFSEQVVVPATLIEEKQLTVWFSVPSVAMFAHKLGMLEPGAFPSLRWSLFCGEALSATLAQAWQSAASNSVLENLYGPTEATIAISCYRWDRQHSPVECSGGVVPMGWMFSGQQACVVTEDLIPLPVGETGELCLSGSQVTGGYLNDPEKTRRQFVTIPRTGSSFWYRTGDLVKADDRGCVFYLGRKDHQVKINGYRVELQEIELTLREAAHTELAVAIPWPVLQGSATGIVAAVCGVDPTSDEEILTLCRERLPKYMVPTRIFHFDELPLNANGKIDRNRTAVMVDDNATSAMAA